MTSTVRIAPPNSLVLIAEDPATASLKMFERGQGIVSTPSCIEVACFAEMDGQTNITLGPPPRVTSPPVFAGVLETPNLHVAVWTIDWQKLLGARVPTRRTQIRIWANHPTEPDEVFIGIGE